MHVTWLMKLILATFDWKLRIQRKYYFMLLGGKYIRRLLFLSPIACPTYYLEYCLGMSYYVNFLGGLGGNEFHIELSFATHGSWKKSKAHFAQFLGKWAKLAVLFT